MVRQKIEDVMSEDGAERVYDRLAEMEQKYAEQYIAVWGSEDIKESA